MSIYTFISNKATGIIAFAPCVIHPELNLKIQRVNENLALFYFIPEKMEIKHIDAYTISNDVRLIKIVDFGLNTGEVYYFTVAKPIFDKIEKYLKGI